MPRKRYTIPPVGIGNDREVLRACADTLGSMTGQFQDRIEPLPTTATTADIINKINEILARIQGT